MVCCGMFMRGESARKMVSWSVVCECVSFLYSPHDCVRVVSAAAVTAEKWREYCSICESSYLPFISRPQYWSCVNPSFLELVQIKHVKYSVHSRVCDLYIGSRRLPMFE